MTTRPPLPGGSRRRWATALAVLPLTAGAALATLAAASPSADASTGRAASRSVRAAGTPDGRVGGTTLLDAGGAVDIEDPSMVMERDGTAYLAWGHDSIPRICKLLPQTNRCVQTVVLPAVSGRGFHLLQGAPGVITLAYIGAAPAGAPVSAFSDRLYVTTSMDGGATFSAPTALADEPAGALLTSVTLSGVSLLASSVSVTGVTVRAVSLTQTTTSYGGGAVFGILANDAEVAVTSTGPLLVVNVVGAPPVVIRYAGSGTADDISGWTAPRSVAGASDVLALLQTSTDAELVNRSGAGRKLMASAYGGSSFGHGAAIDNGGTGPFGATVDVNGRLTVVRGGGSGSGLVAISTLRNAVTNAANLGTALTFSPATRVLVPRGIAGARPAVTVDGTGLGLVALRVATGATTTLVLQRFSTPVPVPPKPKPKPTPKPKPSASATKKP